MMSELQAQVVTGNRNVDPGARAYARGKLGQLAKLAPGPVLRARVKLERAPYPALDRPALAKGTLGLAVGGGRLPDRSGCVAAVRPAPAPPHLTLSQATTWLDLTGERYVFFVDATTGRGNVAYRRYDGHYGLITRHGPNLFARVPLPVGQTTL